MVECCDADLNYQSPNWSFRHLFYLGEIEGCLVCQLSRWGHKLFTDIGGSAFLLRYNFSKSYYYVFKCFAPVYLKVGSFNLYLRSRVQRVTRTLHLSSKIGVSPKIISGPINFTQVNKDYSAKEAVWSCRALFLYVLSSV